MHTALYRKWRPAVFSDVVGQKNVTDVLKYEVESGKTTHAYLFCGSRGTGKTTCAKILAKAVNCLNPRNGDPCCECEACIAAETGSGTDIIELDAASNNGVDDVRAIRDDVSFLPAFLRKKVYIIDEAHMLSGSAFNALLKTLEEPPEHVVFILATTEFQKLPVTIVSRCQRFDFRRISASDIASRLSFIASQEGIEIPDDALERISLMAKGGLRDAISLLELCSSSGKKIDGDLVRNVVGAPDRIKLSALVRCVLAKNVSGILRGVASFASLAPDLTVFWQELIDFYRDMLVVRSISAPETLIDVTKEELNETNATAKFFTREKLLYHMSELESTFSEMQRMPSVRRTLAEMTLIKLSDDTLCDSPAALLSRIADIERKLSDGIPVINDSAFFPAPPVGSEPVEQNEKNAVQTEKSMTAFERWDEAVSHVIESEPLYGSHLRNTSAYICGDELRITVSEFGYSILNKDEVKSAIAYAVRETGFENCRKDKVIFKISDVKNGSAIDTLDGLIG